MERDSGIWQTPTLDNSDMSSWVVGFILIYLERAHVVLEIAGEQALNYDVRHSDKAAVGPILCPY